MAKQLEHEQLHHDPSPMTGERFARLREAMARREERAPSLGDDAGPELGQGNPPEKFVAQFRPQRARPVGIPPPG